MISGEPIPVQKAAGDDVVGGTVNGTGSLIIEVTQVGDDTFVVVEKWASLDALKAHAAAPHMAAYAAKAKDMIADRVIHVLSPT